MSYSEEIAKTVLDQYLKGFKYYDNFRPSWLGGLELDRFYPDLGVAIEFQGGQHFRPVPGMHQTEEDFRRQVSNDSQKSQILYKYGYKLFPLEMIDLDESKLKGLIIRIVSEGKKYAATKGNTQVLAMLGTVRYEYPINESLRKEVSKLSFQKDKRYFGTGSGRPGWLLRLLRQIFLPRPGRRRY